MDINIDISVIVPVYNVKEQYFNRMINSLLAQKGDISYEVIIVDDGSDEDTRKMIDSYCDNSEIIKCFHNKNMGVSYSRNYGTKMARGMYVAYVDGDDYVSSNYLETSLQYAKKYNADIVYGTIEYCPASNLVVEQKQDDSIDILSEENIDAIKASLMGYTRGLLKYAILGSPCGRLFRKQILDKVNFREELYLYEDQVFNREVLDYACKAVVCSEVWYYYVQYDNSALHKDRNEKDCYSLVKPYWDCMYSINKEEKEFIKKIMIVYSMNQYLGYMKMVFCKTRSIIERYTQLKCGIHNPLMKFMCEISAAGLELSRTERCALHLLRRRHILLITFLYSIYFRVKVQRKGI